MHRILFICHGNICRSTMAQFVMEDLVRHSGRSEEFKIDSAATSCEELGNSPHSGTVRELARHGVPVFDHRARQVKRADYDAWDLLIYMDEENERALMHILGDDSRGKCRKLLSFAGEDRDVADPWYTGDFSATYRDVVKGCTALLEGIG